MPKSAHKKIVVEVPTYDRLLWPTLKALKALGGSATIQELVDKIIEIEEYSEDIQKVSHDGSGRDTKLEYNAAWARSYLKKVGAINNSQRGIWLLMEVGEKMTEKDMLDIPRRVHRQGAEEKKRKKELRDAKKAARPKAKQDIDDIEEEEIEEEDWKDQLLSKVLKLKPNDFERLCQLILRESGFIKVAVTGKTGDGGIDGIGILRINLLSFHVSFQCKRYQ